MKITKKTLLNNSWFLFIGLFIIYRPEFLIQFDWADSLMNVLRIVFVVFILLLYLYSRRLSITVIWIVVIWGGYNLLCFYNKTWNFSVFIEFALILSITMLVDMYATNRFHIVDIAIHRLLYMYGILNTITILVGEKVEHLFLGFDNDISMRVIPLIGVMLYSSMVVRGRLNKSDFAISLIFLLDFILTWSATAVVSLTVVYCLIYAKKLKYKYFNSKSVVASSILVWVGLFVFHVQQLFSILLVAVLHKDLTLSFRMYIWDSVVTAIFKRPILGYGNIMNSDVYYDITYKMYYASIAPHNFWLYICVSGGVIGVLLVIFFINKCFKTVDKQIYYAENKILIAALIGYMLCGIFASYYGIEYLMFLLAVADKSKVIAASNACLKMIQNCENRGNLIILDWKRSG